MTFVQYLRILRKHWFTVLALTLLATLGAAAFTRQQQPVYAATTQLFVSVGGSQTDISELQQGSTFTQQRVKSYADVVTSPVVAQGVIDKLDLPYSASELAKRVTVTNPLDTVLLDITVNDSNPRRAADIANAVASEFPKLVAQLETPAGRVISPVKVSVTQQAGVPEAPVSPRLPLNLALGLLVGLGLGIAAAVLRDQMNTTVGDVAEIEKATGSVPLGVVPFDKSTDKQPLVRDDEFTGRAEAFRTLRTNLQFADVDNPPRRLVVTSALPSEGKSTTACNLALTLALSGARVILVDGDLRKPSVGHYLGIDSAAGLTNVLAGQHELADVVVGFQRDTLAVLPSGPTPPNPSELLGSQHMAALLDTLAAEYDVVVIDAAPLLPVTDAAVLSALADGAVLVVRHGRTRREEMERALQALAAVNAKLLGTVMNGVPRRRRGRDGYDGYGYGYGYGEGAASPGGLAAAADSVASGTGSGGSGRGSKSRSGAGSAVRAAPASAAPATAPAANGSRAMSGKGRSGRRSNGTAEPAEVQVSLSKALGTEPQEAPAARPAGATAMSSGPPVPHQALPNQALPHQSLPHQALRQQGTSQRSADLPPWPLPFDSPHARGTTPPERVDQTQVPWSEVVPPPRPQARGRLRRRVISRARG